MDPSGLIAPALAAVVIGLEVASTILDIVSLVDSTIKFAEEPSIENGLWLLADIIGVVNPFPSLGLAKYAKPGRIDDAAHALGFAGKHTPNPKPFVDDVVPTVRTPREKPSTTRGKWEKANEQEWPKEKDGITNQQISHATPLADGGTNELTNIGPITKDEHIKLHKENGDFARWGRRALKQFEE